MSYGAVRRTIGAHRGYSWQRLHLWSKEVADVPRAFLRSPLRVPQGRLCLIHRTIYDVARAIRVQEFNSDISRRDFITIGASAGFSSAFGAPIGGVMFGMEECATHFPHKMLWRTLMATAIACFTVFFMSEAIGEDADISSYGVLSFGTHSIGRLHLTLSGDLIRTSTETGKFVNPELYPWELPLFLLLGAFMGLLGALFNHMAHIFFHFRKHTIKQKHHHVAEIALISLVPSLTPCCAGTRLMTAISPS